MPIALTRTGDAPLPPEITLQGSGEVLVELLAGYARAGLQHLLMCNLGPTEAVVDQIAQIAAEVLPQVAALRSPA
jgi:hypothetical protein